MTDELKLPLGKWRRRSIRQRKRGINGGQRDSHWQRIGISGSGIRDWRSFILDRGSGCVDGCHMFSA